MARSDEGEFELVLGNKQLISVFLVVVILLGVFFSMGYIVGRSSAPAASTEAAHNGGGKAIVVETPAAASRPAPAKTDSSTAAAETQPGGSTQPEKPSPAPAKETAKDQPKGAKPPAIAPAAAAQSTAGNPAPGDYWQVVATTRPDAEIITQALAKKGFHATIASVPGDTSRFRVLVGPLANAAAQAQTRADLEASGFKSPIMRKY